MKNKKLQGFTLIELLIVIGIIAILAGIVLVAVNPAQQFGKANDSERKSEIGTILSAIYQFQTAPSARGALPECIDVAGTLGTAGSAASIPACGTNYAGAIELGTAAYNCAASGLLVPSYLREIPVDPSGTPNFDDDNTGYYVCQTAPSSPSTSTVVVLAPGAEVFITDGGCQMDNPYVAGTDVLDVMCVGS